MKAATLFLRLLLKGKQTNKIKIYNMFIAFRGAAARSPQEQQHLVAVVGRRRSLKLIAPRPTSTKAFLLLFLFATLAVAVPQSGAKIQKRAVVVAQPATTVSEDYQVRLFWVINYAKGSIFVGGVALVLRKHCICV